MKGAQAWSWSSVRYTGDFVDRDRPVSRRLGSVVTNCRDSELKGENDIFCLGRAAQITCLIQCMRTYLQYIH